MQAKFDKVNIEYIHYQNDIKREKPKRELNSLRNKYGMTQNKNKRTRRNNSAPNYIETFNNKEVNDDNIFLFV